MLFLERRSGQVVMIGHDVRMSSGLASSVTNRSGMRKGRCG